MTTCLATALIAFGGWFVTAIGWYVTNNLANGRETRKEVRTEIDKLSESLEKLLESSHKYYCCGESIDRTLAESQIYGALNTLSGLVERLEERDSSLKIQKKLDDLYEAITGGDFGSTVFTPDCVLYAEKSKRLSILAETIRTTCEKWFKGQFQ